ncbi:tetratricopeptide repeat protein [uncultured Flavobacterium sp.]|uniref:tetratricopeptide repeat protein n=1 Tax=uncultured Flavobacterium sp. TaxID=165435 RepID=UPI0030C8BA0B
MKNLKKMMWFTMIISIVTHQTKAQTNKFIIPDSLKNKSLNDLELKTINNQEKEKSIAYAKTWLLKSKSEQNWSQIDKAYRTIMYLENKEHLLHYADSLLFFAKKSKDNKLIGTAYLTKGIMYYDKKEVTKALDYYILAEKYISITKDEYTIYKVKYSIAHTKYYLGFYDEAIALFRDCLTYFEEENDRGYLNTLHSLALCYNKLGNYNQSTYYNELGLLESKELENSEMEMYFKHAEAVNQYFKKEYKKAINNLKLLLPSIQEKKDIANETVAYFYIGKSFWALKQEEKAIPYLLKVDNAFKEHKYTKPELRENYELLIKWYAKQDNLKAQLKYINKLIEVDKLMDKNYKYLAQKIFKEYDTKKLIGEKLEIENAMKTKSKVYYTIFTTLAIIIVFITAKHYNDKKKFKAKFDELMKTNPSKRNVSNYTNEELEIKHEIVEQVLKNLDKFEKNQKYLEKEMNLSKLATILNTNTKYASKIIAKHRGKGSIDYITDLKIDYIVEKLKNENKFRNYTNKALGEEAGFRSTQNFTRAFKNKTKISPTYFIAQLKQQEIS